MPVIFRRNDERASFVRVSAIWEFLANMGRERLASSLIVTRVVLLTGAAGGIGRALVPALRAATGASAAWSTVGLYPTPTRS